MINTLKFTGRDVELEKIKERWRLSSDIKNPKPQIVLIKGERGLGKTRLAFEFYKWLSETVDFQSGQHGYWPDAMSIYQNAIDVNPKPDKCNYDFTIPYLWWGLHVSEDTIPMYDHYLAPHLAALLTRAVMQRKGLNMAAALAHLGFDLGMSILEDVTQYTTAKRIYEAFMEAEKIVRSGVSETSIQEALQAPSSRANSILSNLELVFNPNRNYASVPGVILIDDAQDANPEKDPAILSFSEQLIHNAITQNWPMLILITHWKRELSLDVSPAKDSFAGLLHHCKFGKPSDLGPAASLPGGFLNDDNFTEIDLAPLDDLSLALKECLPGLTNIQQNGLIQATGGNPRFLEQIIHFSHENEGFFEDFDTSKPLTDIGFDEILSETKNQDIFKVVRRRLLDAPEDVRETICLASLQGMRFVNDLVAAIANVQTNKDIQSALEQAKNPYYWIEDEKQSTNEKIGTFAEQLFLQVAENLRPHIKSLGGESKLQNAFKDAIRKVVQNKEFVNSDQLETQLITYSIAADLFEKSDDPEDLSLAQVAMSYVAMVHLRRESLEAATAAYERLLKTPPSNGWVLGDEWQERIKVLDFLTASYRRLNWPSKLSTAYKRMIWMGYHQIDDQNQKVFVFSRTAEEVRQVFNDWKQEKLKNIIEGGYFDDMQTKPDIAFLEKRLEEDYFNSVNVIVKALLGLAELALAWPSLTFDDGDDPISEVPFMVKSLQVDNDGNLTGEKIDLKGSEVFLLHKERAYILGTLLGENFVHYEHFKLLVDDIARTYNDQNNSASAIDAIERAIAIAEEMGDLILQIQALNDLGMVLGQNGDYKKSEETLLKAGKIYNENYVGDSFSVVVISNNGSIEFCKAEDVSKEHTKHIVGKIDILSQFASLFNLNPNEAVQQTRKLITLGGDIESNLGLNLLYAGELDKAENRLQYAMEGYASLNDGPKIAGTYENFGVISMHRGEIEKACDWWNKSISIYKKLVEVDNANGRDILWKREIKRLNTRKEKLVCGQ